jgi:hypothetical protein
MTSGKTSPRSSSSLPPKGKKPTFQQKVNGSQAFSVVNLRWSHARSARGSSSATTGAGRNPSLRSFAPLSRGFPRARPEASPTRTPALPSQSRSVRIGVRVCGRTVARLVRQGSQSKAALIVEWCAGMAACGGPVLLTKRIPSDEPARQSGSRAAQREKAIG